jgi:hypothetical protein
MLLEMGVFIGMLGLRALSIYCMVLARGSEVSEVLLRPLV